MGTRIQTGDRTSGRTMALEHGEVTVEIDHRGETTMLRIRAAPVVQRLGLAGVRREALLKPLEHDRNRVTDTEDVCSTGQ